MGVSALGTGSGILTQDLLDQLKKADETAQINPITLDIANEKDKQGVLSTIDAGMTNLADSITELKAPTLFDERKANITSGTSIEITADANSDIQDFTLEVKQLAEKQISESGKFGDKTDKIASADGSVTISVGDNDIDIDYNSDMTLDDFKKAINDQAGDYVTASIVKLADDDYRLFLTSKDTGANTDISIADNDGNLSGTQLTDDMTSVQDGQDAVFTYNGSDDITRSSNDVDDLITGYDITLKSVGTTEVSVEQNHDKILEKVDSFISQFNSIMGELSRDTKNSKDSSERGIFSGDSLLKGLKSTLMHIFSDTAQGGDTLLDIGFDMDKSGTISVDKTKLNDYISKDSSNFEAFFTGGSYSNQAGSDATDVNGVFNDMDKIIQAYTKFNGLLDESKNDISSKVSDLEDRKLTMQARLDDRYNSMQKQFTAYDAMIAKLKNTSTMFTQMMDANKQKD